MKPWKLSKEQIENGMQLPILHLTMEALRVSGIMLQPIVPSLASTLLSRLGVPITERMWCNSEYVSWKGGPSAAGYKLGLGQIKLFEKIGEKKNILPPNVEKLQKKKPNR